MIADNADPIDEVSQPNSAQKNAVRVEYQQFVGIGRPEVGVSLGRLRNAARTSSRVACEQWWIFRLFPLFEACDPAPRPISFPWRRRQHRPSRRSCPNAKIWIPMKRGKNRSASRLSTGACRRTDIFQPCYDKHRPGRNYYSHRSHNQKRFRKWFDTHLHNRRHRRTTSDDFHPQRKSRSIGEDLPFPKKQNSYSKTLKNRTSGSGASANRVDGT